MDWKYAEHDMPKNISEKEIPDSQLKVDWCICFTILFFTYSQFDMHIDEWYQNLHILRLSILSSTKWNTVPNLCCFFSIMKGTFVTDPQILLKIQLIYTVFLIWTGLYDLNLHQSIKYFFKLNFSWYLMIIFATTYFFRIFAIKQSEKGTS